MYVCAYVGTLAFSINVLGKILALEIPGFVRFFGILAQALACILNLLYLLCLVSAFLAHWRGHALVIVNDQIGFGTQMPDLSTR